MQLHKHNVPQMCYRFRHPTCHQQLWPTKNRFLRRLLRILVHSGFFVLQKSLTEVCYFTDSSRLLLKGRPLSLAPFLLSVLEPEFTKPRLHLLNWFQNDDPTPCQTAYGVSYWECAGHVPERSKAFNSTADCPHNKGQKMVSKNLQSCD